MSRFTTKYAFGREWTYEEWEAMRDRQRANRRGPYIIRDTTDPFVSMADGRMYDSKRAYRADLNARGLVEVGDDKSMSLPGPQFEPEGVEQSIKDAIDQLSAE